MWVGYLGLSKVDRAFDFAAFKVRVPYLGSEEFMRGYGFFNQSAGLSSHSTTYTSSLISHLTVIR